MTRPILYIDLDGTLIEPSTGIFACIRHALTAIGEASPADDALRSWVGPPLRDSFARHVGERRAGRAIAAYRERYDAIGWRECTLYPDMDDTLGKLVGDSYDLIVATSKPAVYAERIIDYLGLADCFIDVIGAELDGRLSYKDELLAFAEERHGSRGIAMLGDRKYDIEGARANALIALGAAWGFGSRDELERAGASRILAGPGDLPAALSSLGHGLD